MASDPLIEYKVHAILSEYETLREDLLHATEHQRQVVLVSIGSAAVAIPGLLSLSKGTFTPTQLALILFVISLVFAVLAANFASTMHEIAAVGRYTDGVLRKQLNTLLKTPENGGLLGWEPFISQDRTHTASIMLSSMGPILSAILVAIPSPIAIVAANYVLSTTPTPIGLITAIGLGFAAALATFGAAFAIVTLFMGPIYQVASYNRLETRRETRLNRGLIYGGLVISIIGIVVQVIHFPLAP